MIVGLLLIAALLVDRFVLLPEFDGGAGSSGVALGAWLGVNLLPALAWLGLNARRSDRTRGQLLAGTLAVIATTAVLIIPVLIWWTAEESQGDMPERASTTVAPTPEAIRVAESCNWGKSDRRLPDDAVRETFADAAEGEDVALLMQGTLFRPGDQFSIAVRNDLNDSVLYGVETAIEEEPTGDLVPLGVPLAYVGISLIAPAGDTGPCVSVLIPSGIDPGTYRAVLEIDPQRDERQLTGVFEVAGEPIADGWEEEFAKARRSSRR